MKQHESNNLSEREARALSAWREVRLSSDEKRAMRLALFEHVERNPAKVRSLGWQLFFGYRRSFAGALALILLVSTGVGVVRASEQALPGETLYPVKTKVNEPVRGWFYRTPETKAAWEKQLIDRRIEEADELAAANTLGENESQQIAELLEQHRNSLEDDGIDEVEVTKFLETRGKHTRVEVNEEGKERRYRIVRREAEERKEHEDEKLEAEHEESFGQERELEEGDTEGSGLETRAFERRSEDTVRKSGREPERSGKDSKKNGRSQSSEEVSRETKTSSEKSGSDDHEDEKDGDDNSGKSDDHEEDDSNSSGSGN